MNQPSPIHVCINCTVKNSTTGGTNNEVKANVLSRKITQIESGLVLTFSELHSAARPETSSRCIDVKQANRVFWKYLGSTPCTSIPCCPVIKWHSWSMHAYLSAVSQRALDSSTGASCLGEFPRHWSQKWSKGVKIVALAIWEYMHVKWWWSFE